MSTNDTRLDRLLPGLTAKERAILMLRDFKAEKPQDRQLLNTAPERQTHELNRMIGLMNAANGDLAHLIVIIMERAKQEELRFSWLEWANMCALQMWGVRAHFCTSGKEAITDSEYRKREQEARDELIPVEECATIYTEDYHAWDAADYETDEKDGEQYPTDEAWYRVRDRKVAELRALVAAGTLTGKGRGKRLKISCGAFYDWLGKPVPSLTTAPPSSRPPSLATSPRGPSSPTSAPATARPGPTASSSASSRLSSMNTSTARRSRTVRWSPPRLNATARSTTPSGPTRR